MNEKLFVSIVSPFFNEAGIVTVFCRALLQEIESLPDYHFEIICVDDGSQDDTLVELLSFAALDNRFTVVELSRNFGKEAALTAGLDLARGDVVITIDSDLQDPISLIGRLLSAWQDSRADVVLAKRTDRQQDSRAKRTTAKAYYSLHNSLSSVRIPMNVGDCRLMTRQVVQALSQLPETQRFMKGLFAWVGFKTAVIEYTRDKRASGTSKFSWWKLWNFGIEGITSFSTLPLRVWTYVGITGALVSLVFGVYVVLRTLIVGTDVPGYASVFVGILFFGSVQLIGLGILGEYVGRLYMESKRRPTYLIRNLHGQEGDPTEKKWMAVQTARQKINRK